MALLDTALGKLLAAVVAAVLLFGVGYWRGHRAGYASGVGGGNAKVAAFTAQDQQASSKAAAAARDAQAAADAKAIADATRLADAGQHAASSAQSRAANANDQLARLRAQLANEVRHDPTVQAWNSMRVPAGVRSVLNGAAH